MISLIAAVSRNGYIGKDGKLPWHIPGDLKRFKELTVGHPIIMGRKTFESIGKSLPHRTNIVLTSQPEKLPDTVIGVRDKHQAVSMAYVALNRYSNQSKEIFVIGGGEVYKHFLPVAKNLYITEVEGDVVGDVKFPTIDNNEWYLYHHEYHIDSPYDYSFLEYERVKFHETNDSAAWREWLR
jgi:dihydrofolate reductase